MSSKVPRYWALGIGLVAILCAISAWQISKARCYQLVGEVTCRVETDRKVVALTFDDGPTPEGVDQVLPVLDKFGVKATFFLIGSRMEKYPHEAGRLRAAGHELGNHTFSHQRNLLRPRSYYRNEVRKTDRLFRREGVETGLFHPPFGKRLVGLPPEDDAAGYRTVIWDIEERPEAFANDPKGFADDILSRVRPGSIILIHLMYRHNQTARDALPLVLNGLQARGYEVVPVGQLLAMEGR